MPPAGDAVLLSLFTSLPSLPKQPYLQYTAAMVVAAYAKWLSQSAQAGQQHLLTQLLQMLTKGEMLSRSALLAQLDTGVRAQSTACLAGTSHMSVFQLSM